MTAIILFTVFFILLSIDVPIAVCIGLATLSAMLATMHIDIASATVAQRIGTGLDSFTLLAIPFFILAGYLMSQGGIARRLIDAAKALVGTIPGGVAFTNVISCVIFGSVSGSDIAATSAIGGFMTPEMSKSGYSKPFIGAVTVTASTTGLLIPPSNVLIVYAVASGGVSVAALFAAGYVPGLILAAALMFTCFLLAVRGKFSVSDRLPAKVAALAVVHAVPAILLLVIIIGGILSGVFTATESGAVAVLYTLVLSLFIYRELSIKDLGEIFVKTAETTGIVMLLIRVSSAMAWMMSYANIPEAITDTLLLLSNNPIIILLIINALLLLIGAFLDITPAVLIFTPILLPVVTQFGMSPEQFGIMIVLNFSIGLCTPPVGSVLFVGAAVVGTSIEKMIRPLLPFYLAMIATLLCVTFIPALSESLPRALGLMQ